LFELPYRKILFLDLDTVLQRRAPTELFDMTAPAGMFHGHHPLIGRIRHGELIPPSAFLDHGGCINARVTHIDTCETALEREKQMAYMCDKIRKMTSAEASHLPEQHFFGDGTVRLEAH
jgi:hypothetical protein